MSDKTCFKCNKSKSFSEFYKHKAMADGHLGKCKQCTKIDVRKNYSENKDHYQRYDQLRAMLPHRVLARKEYQSSKNGSEAMRRSAIKWIEKNPIKRLANQAVGNAVRDGRLYKPSACTECGKSGRIHGHHCDYAKVFDVMWLCPACHMRWHKLNGKGVNAE